MTTEAEAKTKWCPMVRCIAIGSTENISTGINRYNPQNPEEISGATCIGSKCMMWRWSQTFHDGDGPGARSKTGGYCGLAGNS